MILGEVDSYVPGTGVTLLIDGEDAPTTKAYSFLGSYVPTPGDRVLIAKVSGTYVVLGAVVKTATQ